MGDDVNKWYGETMPHMLSTGDSFVVGDKNKRKNARRGFTSVDWLAMVTMYVIGIFQGILIGMALAGVI